MNKLEQLHLDAINNNICSESNYSAVLGENEAASKSAEITKQIAIEFAEWLSSLIISNYKSGGNWYHKGMIYSTNMLFQEFIKTKQ